MSLAGIIMLGITIICVTSYVCDTIQEYIKNKYNKK